MRKVILFFLLFLLICVGLAQANSCPTGETASYFCPFGFTLSSDNSTCYSQPSCPTGSSYNPSTNRCEAQPLTGDTKCSPGWTYDQSKNVCCISATCPDNSTLQNGQCEIQPTVTCQSPNSGNFNLTGYYCFESNSSGSLTNYKQCYNTNSGYLCPLDMQQCTAAYTNPTCPSGGTLDTTLHKCTAQPNPTCPSGYTYDSSIDRCAAPAQCPDGGSLNPYTDRCEIVVTSSLCPSGYIYNTTYEACVKTPTCPSGGTYNPNRDRCEYQVTKSCPSGYTYDSGKDICEANPQCPSGTSYNATYNECLVSANLTCPSGYTQSGGKCVANPECPSGSSYNSNTNRCEMPAGASFGSGNSCVNFDSVTNCLEFSNGNVRTFTHGNSNSYGQWISLSSSTASESSSNVGLFGDLRVYASNYELFINSSSPKVSLISGGDTGKVILSASVISGYCYEGWCNYIAAAKIEDIQASNGKVRLGVTGSEGAGSNPSEAVSNAIAEARTKSISWGSWVSVYTPSCPSGWTLSGSICYKSATCPAGGSLNTSDDKCEVPLQTNCPSGTTYDSSINYCTASATCPSGGSLNTSTDKCQISVTNECPSNYTYDSSTNLCYSSPICDYGYYDSSINLCRLSASSVCPSGYTFDNASDKCVKSPDCQPPGSYSDTLNECGTLPIYNCPAGYSYNSTDKLCEANPQCDNGTFDSSNNECYEGNYTCPAGKYQCLPYNGSNYCSPYPCVNMSNGNNTQTTQANLSSYTNDGKYDSNGNCLGTIYIFNGKGYECRPPGLSTLFTNCCSKAYKKQGKILLVLPQCDKEDARTDMLVQSGVCHYVGEYCSWKLKFPSICLQHKKVYCCFHSKLGRIIQEQGRPQLKDFGYSGDWGSPTSPNCRGFTPDEFQMLDFNKMDLSSYFGDIAKKVAGKQKEIEQKAQQNISNFYNQTR